MGLGRQRQRHWQITKRFYSKQWYSSVEYMKNKQNEVSQDGWKREQNNTAQRLYRNRKKKNMLKTITLTENTDIRKAMAMHWREASDGQEQWLMHWGWLKSDLRSSLHTGQYAGCVPSDHSQRQALLEPLSLPGVAWNVNEFLCETAQKGGSGLAVHTSGGFDCNWLKVVIVKKAIVFLALGGLSISCYTAWYSGTDYVVSDFLQRCPQLSRPIQDSCLCTKGLGSDHRAFYFLSGQRAQG